MTVCPLCVPLPACLSSFLVAFMFICLPEHFPACLPEQDQPEHAMPELAEQAMKEQNRSGEKVNSSQARLERSDQSGPDQSRRHARARQA